MRALATIETIKDLQPIKGADRIEVATVRGWKVVVGKGLYKVGDLCVYHEIDSLCPNVEPYAKDLIKLNLRDSLNEETNEIVQGYLIKTMSLKKQISQGYCVPLTVYSEDMQKTFQEYLAQNTNDVTSLLGITLYNKPEISEEFSSTSPRNYVPSTSLTRVQNILNTVWDYYLNDEVFEVTVKLDGTSISVINHPEFKGIASRNNIISAEAKESKYNLAGIPLLERIPEGYSLQGELIGPKIQGNFEGLEENTVYVYNVLNGFEYLQPKDVKEFCINYQLNYVPLLGYFTLKDFIKTTIDTPEELLEAILKLADGPSSFNGQYREGLVFKSTTNSENRFKVISNKYLLGEKHD